MLDLIVASVIFVLDHLFLVFRLRAGSRCCPGGGVDWVRRGFGEGAGPKSGYGGGFAPSFHAFANDLVPLGLGDGGTGCATGGFSAQSRRVGWCAEVGNNPWHTPTNLSWGEWPIRVFPW